MATRTNTELKSVESDKMVNSKEVSINVGGLGVLNLSGVYKAKRAEIMARWNGGQIGVSIQPNTFGRKTGYVIMASDDKLVGFLNFFAPTDHAEAEEQFMNSHFDEYVNVVDMSTL